LNLLYCNTRGNQSPGLRIVVETMKPMFEPLRHGSATARGEAQYLWESCDGQDSGHNGRVDSRSRATIAEAQEQIVVIEELRDRTSRAGIDLPLQVIEIKLRRWSLRVHLGIGGYRDVKVGDPFQPRDQIGCIREAIWVRRVLSLSLRWVTA